MLLRSSIMLYRHAQQITMPAALMAPLHAAKSRKVQGAERRVRKALRCRSATFVPQSAVDPRHCRDDGASTAGRACSDNMRAAGPTCRPASSSLRSGFLCRRSASAGSSSEGPPSATAGVQEFRSPSRGSNIASLATSAVSGTSSCSTSQCSASLPFSTRKMSTTTCGLSDQPRSVHGWQPGPLARPSAPARNGPRATGSRPVP